MLRLRHPAHSAPPCPYVEIADPDCRGLLRRQGAQHVRLLSHNQNDYDEKRVSAWLENDLPIRFEGRILTIDAALADACGTLVAKTGGAGQSMEVMDAFPAATAQLHQLILVTRDTTHFQPTLKAPLNPWT